MALQHKYSRILTQEDFDSLNTQYGLELEFDSVTATNLLHKHQKTAGNALLLHCYKP